MAPTAGIEPAQDTYNTLTVLLAIPYLNFSGYIEINYIVVYKLNYILYYNSYKYFKIKLIKKITNVNHI